MVVCKDDVVQYILSLLILNGRIGKWILGLTKFDFVMNQLKQLKARR
jgi:hypothetical protein